MKHPVPALRLAFLFGLSATACAQDFSVVKMGHVLRFEGAITPDSAKAINAMIGDDIDVLLVDSPGGDGVGGLSIAKALRKHDVMVVVDKYCMSACANYLFVGANRKSLNPGAILGFHGGLTGAPRSHSTNADYPLLTEAQLATLEEKTKLMYDDESVFYASIGFDPSLLKTSSDLTELAVAKQYIDIGAAGKTVRYGFGEVAQAKAWMAQLDKAGTDYTFNIVNSKQSETKFYFPSRHALEQHGVTGIGHYEYADTAAGRQRIAAHLGQQGDYPDLTLVGDPAP